MKISNKLLIITSILSLLFSCRSEGIFQSSEIIRNIEKNKNFLDYFEISYEKEKSRVENNYKSIFKFRNKKIKLLVKQRKLKDFAIEELFYYNPIANKIEYTIYIIGEDSAYGFNTKAQDNINKFALREFNQDRVFFAFRNDSIVINKGLLYEQNEKFPSYISTYKNKKLDLLLTLDSIVYKKKNSKTDFNFNIKKWYNKDEECCEKKGMVKCIGIKMEKY